MIAAGPAQPGGERPNIAWQAAPIETAALRPAYGLIVAAASLHWMDWDAALPRFARHLAPGGALALVEEHSEPDPWNPDIFPLAQRYSMNKDFAFYNMATVAAELEKRGLFKLQGTHETPPMRFRQPVDDWVESFHARNGFSRDRLDPADAAAFDAAMRAAVLPHCPDGIVERRIAARIVWGVPLAPG